MAGPFSLAASRTWPNVRRTAHPKKQPGSTGGTRRRRGTILDTLNNVVGLVGLLNQLLGALTGLVGGLVP